MKIALVYDRVNKWGGAERVLLALHEIFPEAPLFTSVYASENAPWAKVFPEVVTSFLQSVPFARYHHEKLATIMPVAFESLDFEGFDVVISVTSEFAKGIVTSPETRHICYCLTPTRYLWSGHDEYFNNPILKLISKPVVTHLKRWDKQASMRPDKIVAISNTVKSRIERYYDQIADVIYPPVETDKFSQLNQTEKKDYFLVVSRLVGYKKVDLVIDAFNDMQLPLVIVGSGKEEFRLKSMAKNNVSFVSGLTDGELANYYRKARALVFPQVEDFGLVAVEAQAAGTPVIAYRGGGAIETVTEKTGLFFDRQDKESIIGATQKFLTLRFRVDAMRQNAKRFSKRHFQENMKRYINNSL